MSSATGQSVPVSGPIYSTKEAVSESIKAVPCDRDLRLEGVRKLFLAAGATVDDIKIEKFDKDKISNLVVRKKGKTSETVVIGAHYDRTSDGCGVTDNWSGVTIISHIFGTLRPLTTNKSYTFVAFDREEEGLKGSRAMVKEIPDAERDNVCSMVNFDSFGQAYPMALKNASSTKLLDLAEDLAKQSKITFNSVTIEGASSDSEAFREKKIPAITMSGLGSNWTEILHSGNDKLDKVNMDSIYLGYRFGLLFISKVEAATCGSFR
jgi:Zn-dependent M28 family amino/carboxypeptidase